MVLIMKIHAMKSLLPTATTGLNIWTGWGTNFWAKRYCSLLYGILFRGFLDFLGGGGEYVFRKKKWMEKMIMYLINCLSLKQEFGKRYDDQLESNQKFSVEFETGTEYLQWLELQLPYVEVSDVFVSFEEVKSKSPFTFCLELTSEY